MRPSLAGVDHVHGADIPPTANPSAPTPVDRTTGPPMEVSMSIFYVARRIAAAVTVVGAVATAPTPASASLCLPVHATGEGQDNDGMTQAIIKVNRVQIGTTSAAFAITGGTSTVVDFTGSLEFTARAGLGTLAIDPITGTLNAVTGSFHSEGDVTGGGLLTGVTGHLVLDGTENLGTGEFTETITGRLCAGQRPGVLTTALAGT
jgi:hypothetical protein